MHVRSIQMSSHEKHRNINRKTFCRFFMVYCPVGKCHNTPETLQPLNGTPSHQRYSNRAQPLGFILCRCWVLMCLMKNIDRNMIPLPLFCIQPNVHPDDRYSVGNLRISTHPSLFLTRKRDSSNWETSFHSSLVHFQCFSVYCRYRWRWPTVTAAKRIRCRLFRTIVCTLQCVVWHTV